MNISIEKRSRIVYFAVGLYVVLLLWITIFSRTPSQYVFVFYPLKSYTDIFSGDISSVKDIVGNILLFIPVGYFFQAIVRKSLIKTILVGLGISLAIELVQLFANLGCFEFDDILHNSIGTLLGYIIYKKIPIVVSFELKKFIKWSLISITIAIMAIVSFVKISGYVSHQSMLSFAELSDTVDKKNLLVLNGNEGRITGEYIYLTYMDDGQLRVTGTTEGVWLNLGEITLEPGDYIFGGAAGVKEDTLSLVLQYYNEEKDTYCNLTPYVDSDVNADFSLDKETSIRAYIRVYNVTDCEIFVRPVIYKK